MGEDASRPRTTARVQKVCGSQLAKTGSPSRTAQRPRPPARTPRTRMTRALADGQPKDAPRTNPLRFGLAAPTATTHRETKRCAYVESGHFGSRAMLVSQSAWTSTDRHARSAAAVECRENHNRECVASGRSRHSRVRWLRCKGSATRRFVRGCRSSREAAAARLSPARCFGVGLGGALEPAGFPRRRAQRSQPDGRVAKPTRRVPTATRARSALAASTGRRGGR
jgi:hypothetical protein